MRYVVLNSCFLLAVITVVLFHKPSPKMRKRLLLTVLGLVLLTALFDPLIIRAGIVAYHKPYTLGISFWGAPLEDFFYAVASGLLLPVIWSKHEKDS